MFIIESTGFPRARASTLYLVLDERMGEAVVNRGTLGWIEHQHAVKQIFQLANLLGLRWGQVLVRGGELGMQVACLLRTGHYDYFLL